jgi:hypothetical protein
LTLQRTTFTNLSIIHFLLILFYKLSLDLVYLKTIGPFYDYVGMVLDFSMYKYIFSTILVLIAIPAIVKCYENGSISSTTILLLNLMYFIPGATLFAFAGLPDRYFLFFGLYWFLLFFWNFAISAPSIRGMNDTSRRLLFWMTMVSIILLSLGITALYGQFRLQINLADVYQLRFAQREMNLPTFVSYFQPIAATLVPLMMVYCFVNKKYLWGAGLLAIQLLSFGFGGNKSTLFYAGVGLLAYFFYSQRRIVWLPAGFIALNLMALAELSLMHFSYLSAYIQNRVLFIPNLLSWQYFNFFEKNELLLLRDSILRRIGLESPYPLQTPFLIGDLYYKDPSMNANNGLCGDAYSNFGWAGLLFYPFAIAVILKLFDSLSFHLDKRIVLTAAVIFTIGLTNISFFSLLLTNGLIFALLLLFILPKK